MKRSLNRNTIALAAFACVTALLTGCASTDSDFPTAPNDARYDHVNPIGMRFVYISPGEFDMGSPHLELGRRENEEQHTVRLTNGYYIGTFEVTIGQWKQYVKSFNNGYGAPSASWNDPGFWQTSEDHPVVNVSWYDAMQFCQWLSRIDGRNYRLPTEAEWEYASRGGNDHGWNNGMYTSRLDDNIDGIGWRQIYGDVTTPVGRFMPNAWGIYDTQGNVMEWIGDYYCRYDEATFQTNPAGPDMGCDRVVRGGHFNADALQSRVAHRQGKPPTVRSNAIGFRVVMDPEGCQVVAPVSSACGNCLTIHAVNKPRCINYAPRPNRQMSVK